MSNAERDKWDERYRGGAYEGRTHPTALLAAWLPFFPRGRPRNASCIRGTSAIPGGRALDVACGAGRNALFLAAAGYAVDAVDISAEGIARGRRAAEQRGLAIRWLVADLTDRPGQVLPSNRYDLIVWVRYVDRGLPLPLIARLNPGGHLLCEQHLDSAAEVAGPRSAEFRFRPGELRAAAAGLTIRHDFEGIVADPDGRSVALAQLVARAAA